MKELVERTMALYEGSDAVNVIVDLPPDLPILIDTLQMKRVLVNLLDNARGAHRPHGFAGHFRGHDPHWQG
jgi:signal transduction histidine kinase